MLFFAWIGAGLGLCETRNDVEAEDAKSKGGGGRLVRNMRQGLDARSRMTKLIADRCRLIAKRPKVC